MTPEERLRNPEAGSRAEPFSPRRSVPRHDALAGTTSPPTTAEADAAALARWVEKLVVSYELEHFPDCWRAHPGLVMELAALQQWQQSAAAEGAAGNELFLWHDGLDRLRGRLGRWVRLCAGACVKTSGPHT